MELDIQLTSDPIPTDLSPLATPRAGAWVEFRGLVRDDEAGDAIAALEYEAYSPMAEQQVRAILATLSLTRPCLAARVIHRLGVVPAGEAAIYVGIAGRHRSEAFALLTEFMDRLKHEVPIWKTRSVPPPAGAETAATVPIRSAAVPVGPAPSAQSADQVRAFLREICHPLDPEPVALATAAGRVLRDSIRAPEDQPPFTRAAMDGYAVRREDAADRFRIVDEIRAGDWKPRRLNPGEAVRIATGGALPDDGLQVVRREDVQVEGDHVVLRARDDETHIRVRGEDARAGQELVCPGTLLRLGTIGLLASLGVTRPRVTRRPRIVHLATGNELVAAGESPASGQIRDSNSPLVRAFFAQRGIVPDQRRIAEDDTALRAELQRLDALTDLVLISGGASVGDHDFTRRLLLEAGFTLRVIGTTARPGKPLIIGQRQATLAFGLPGNPLAHFVCLHLYVAVALAGWAGLAAGPEFESGTLTSDLEADGNRRETFWPGTWHWNHGSAAITPLRWRSSGDLTSLATANALIRVNPAAMTLAAGSRVKFLDTDHLP